MFVPFAVVDREGRLSFNFYHFIVLKIFMIGKFEVAQSRVFQTRSDPGTSVVIVLCLASSNNYLPYVQQIM